jgi:chromosome segregation protein
MVIHGFKSFYERTEVVLPERTTAVVGPNGCGKSNISDAIHWVLGEQRVRTLRGEKMQDVIFNGSERRKPLGMAEVSLHLLRDGEPLPPTHLHDPDPGTAVLDAGGDAAGVPRNGGGVEASGDAGGCEAPTNGDGAAVPGNGEGNVASRDGDGPAAAGGARGARPAILDGAWPDSIRITRRLFRDGQSEYLIDGARCRLRDVRDVLLRLSVGSGASCIIEQGKVEQIVASKPRDRRLLIEEAAGVAGFKAKKREATLKLEATEANLLRIEDIVGEVRRQINSIKRQAGKARRYKRMMEERRRLERIAYFHRSRELEGRLAEQRRARATVQDEETGVSGRLAEAGADAERLRAEVEEADRRLGEAREALHALDLQIDREERGIQEARKQAVELTAAADAAEAEAAGIAQRLEEMAETRRGREAAALELAERLRRLATLADAGERGIREARAAIAGREASLEARRRSLFDLIDRTSELRNRLERLEGDGRRAAAAAEKAERDAAEAGQERDRLALELAERDAAIRDGSHRAEMLARAGEDWGRQAAVGQEELQITEREAESARLERGSLAERLQALEALDREGSAQGRAARAAGEAHQGVVADFVQPARDLEEAAEIFLADLLPAVVLPDAGTARGAVARLAEAAGGRGSFLVPGLGTPPAVPLPEDLRADPRVRGRLADLLGVTGDATAAVQAAADGAVVVEDLPAALELASRHPGRAFLAATGEVVRPGGLITAGRSTNPTGILPLRRRLAETRESLARAERIIAETTVRARALREGIDGHREQSTRAAEERAALELSLAELRERRKALAEAHERLHRAHGVTSEEAERERAYERDAAEEAGRAREALAGVDSARGSAEAAIRKEAAAVERGREEAEVAAREQADLRSRHEVARERLEAAGAEMVALHRTVGELEARARKLRQDAAARRERRSGLEDLVRRTEISLSANVERRTQEKDRLDAEAASLQGLRDRSRERAVQVRDLGASLEEVRARRMKIEVALSRSESEREFLEQSCRNDLDQSLEEAAAALEEGEADRAPEEVRTALEGIREKIDRLGPVNVMAVEEYTELEGRYEFLTGQQQDLRDSVRSLKDTIARMNRRSRERFQAAFGEIRTNFQETFRLLFGGGRADLLLEEGVEDAMESGVEITAQPPGKRLQRIALLSGGEKALTAIALLFGIFQYRPSPFCVLDEVDAPLDEANVGRYAEMLRQMSDETQFVVITHNKRTMERADVLYGVTMQEPGVSTLVSVRFQDDGRLAAEDGSREVVLQPTPGNGEGHAPGPTP